MGIRRSFKDVPDSTGFLLVSVGKHSARMHVDAYQHDTAGNFSTDGDGEKLYWTTSAGDEKWLLNFEILDGNDCGAIIKDHISFGDGGMARVTIIYKRGGFAIGDETDFDFEPDQIDASCWWITIEHEVSTDFKTGKERPRKRGKFKNNGCPCAVCKKYDGQDVYIQPRITFDGFEPMAAKDAAKFAKMTTPAQIRAAEVQPNDPGMCVPCNMGEHSHTQGKGCGCPHEGHVPF